MVISDEQLQRFQEAWLKQNGREISAENARTELVKLVGMVQLTYTPLTESENEAIQDELNKLRREEYTE